MQRDPRARSLLTLALLVLLVLLAGCLPGPQVNPASRLPQPEPTEAQSRRPSPTRKPDEKPDEQPRATPRPTLGALPEGDDVVAVEEAQRAALERDPLQLAAAFRELELPVPTPAPSGGSVGDSEMFWVLNIEQGEYYTTEATLEVQTDHLQIFVSKQALSDIAGLERSARRFEEQTLPKLLEIFEGQVDMPVATILIAQIPGAAGYYSSEDLLPASANPYSNERWMIYMSPTVAPGEAAFDSTLAHETQHLLHRRLKAATASWFNEGASMLVELLLDYDPSSFAYTFIDNPDVQLNTWSDSPSGSYAHYAQSQLFLAYLYDRLGDRLPLAELARENAGHNLTEFSELTGDEDVGDLISDWAIANLLNDPQVGDGRYAYEALPETVSPQELLQQKHEAQINQLGAHYLLFPRSDETRVLRFEGERLVQLTAAELGDDELAWWSGRGDSRSATLTTTLDLREVEGATLRFQLWHDLEQDYDYGFVAASTDGGRTWSTLAGQHTTGDNPQGLNYGEGYTGASGGWLSEEVDLSSLAGQEAIVGFWVVNDQGYNTPGLMVKDLEVPELGGTLDAWQATGFAEVHNRLPQGWELRAVTLGRRPEVSVVPVEDGRAELRLEAGAQTVLVVIPTTPETTEPTRYQISVEE